jgi:hypothetical protein
LATVADKILEHRELGYQIIGFVDDKAAGDHLGYRGCRCSARSMKRRIFLAGGDRSSLRRACRRNSTSDARTDRQHQPWLVDVKVVPDLLQVIALRARLEDLDGVPVININDVPLQGFNSVVKRAIDVAISSLRCSCWQCRWRSSPADR